MTSVLINFALIEAYLGQSISRMNQVKFVEDKI